MLCSLVFFGGLTALNGKIEDGQYFIGGHGVYEAVSQQMFQRMRGIEGTVLLTSLVGFFGVFGLNLINWLAYPDCNCRARPERPKAVVDKSARP